MKKKTTKIKLKVAWHRIGNRTLMRSIDGAMYRDQMGVFFCNSNAAEFYRALAKLIADHAGEGQQILYEDTSPPCDTTDN